SASFPYTTLFRSDRLGWVVSKTDDAVAAINMYNFWFMVCCFGMVHLSIRDEDDEIGRVDQVGCCPIDAQDTRVAFTGDGVGLEACSVGDVHDRHQFARQDTGGIEEFLVHGYRADIV